MSFKNRLTILKKKPEKRPLHHMQQKRIANIRMISMWAKSDKDRASLAKKAMLTLGCTRDKAYEYIRVILDDE